LFIFLVPKRYRKSSKKFIVNHTGSTNGLIKPAVTIFAFNEQRKDAYTTDETCRQTSIKIVLNLEISLSLSQRIPHPTRYYISIILEYQLRKRLCFNKYSSFMKPILFYLIHTFFSVL
jgi:hypothetical protein